MSAICVQRFDDSLSSAIRITYRISLRSSSLWEPRYPLLRVVFVSYFDTVSSSQVSTMFEKGVKKRRQVRRCLPIRPLPFGLGSNVSSQGVETWIRINDPSAGSPTETLLRLLLPLNDQV